MRRIILAVPVGLVFVTAAPLKSEAGFVRKSDAESMAILGAHYPGYWWDHTELTVAVQAAPNVDATLLQAAHDAIVAWNAVLVGQFGGLITLADVSSGDAPAHNADIVLHYVPHAGGLPSPVLPSVSRGSVKTC